MRSRALAGTLATLALVASAAIPAFASGGGRAASGHTVSIVHSKYIPGTLTINRGDTVTWLWRDGRVNHNVVASGFRSKVQSKGSFTVRFTRSGSFSYKCTVHPKMSGRILVK
ncbi:MAG TPA: plastocyanin/azurin family copper-binding protein [Solirubrobacteraceae bacterium]|jgi:plastocyanin